MDRRHLLRTAAALPALGMAGTAAAAAAQQRKELKITGLETDLLKPPPGEPIYDALQELNVDKGSVVLRIRTDAGITGWASTSFGRLGEGARVVQTILEYEVKPVIMGKDPAFPRRIRAELWKAMNYQGVTGITQFALAATDIALWDILGKHAGLPVYKMLGACRDRMPVYSMCGWYYDNDHDLSRFKQQIVNAVDQGYKGVKIKVGKYTLNDDVRRIRLARDVIGPDRRLMVDANQVFDRKEALQRGKQYQDMGCFWLEEPLPPQDMEGFSLLAGELEMRIATGENLNTRFEFADLIARRGADIVQPDSRRAGGVCEWMDIAAVADAYHVKVASHGGGPSDLNMLLAIPNAIYMEAGGPHKMIDGEVLAPEEPGMGSEVSEAQIRKYRIG